MRRFFVVLIVIILAVSSFAFAETEHFDEQGEWYSGMYYSNDAFPATLNENGDFVATINGFECTISRDGHVISNDESEMMESVSLPCDGLLLYGSRHDSLRKKDYMAGILILPSDDGFNAVYSETISLMLLLNNKAIRYDGESSAEYQRTGSQFFMTNGESYSRGKITTYGNDLFLYKIDGEARIERYGDYEIDYGDPVIFFIRSSLVK